MPESESDIEPIRNELNSEFSGFRKGLTSLIRKYMVKHLIPQMERKLIQQSNESSKESQPRMSEVCSNDVQPEQNKKEGL